MSEYRLKYSDRCLFQVGDNGKELGMIAHMFPNPKVNDELGEYIAECVNSAPSLRAALDKAKERFSLLELQLVNGPKAGRQLIDKYLAEIAEIRKGNGMSEQQRPSKFRDAIKELDKSIGDGVVICCGMGEPNRLTRSDLARMSPEEIGDLPWDVVKDVLKHGYVIRADDGPTTDLTAANELLRKKVEIAEKALEKAEKLIMTSFILSSHRQQSKKISEAHSVIVTALGRPDPALKDMEEVK